MKLAVRHYDPWSPVKISKKRGCLKNILFGYGEKTSLDKFTFTPFFM